MEVNLCLPVDWGYARQTWHSDKSGNLFVATVRTGRIFEFKPRRKLLNLRQRAKLSGRPGI